MSRTLIAFGILAVTVLLSMATASAAEIDHLFAQFQAQHAAGNYRTAEWLARQMLVNSSTDGWYAASYLALGRALLNQGRLEESREALLAALRYPLQQDNVNRGWIPNSLGITYYDDKKYDEAERYFQQARAVFEALKGSTSSEAAMLYMNLGNVARNQKRFDQSEQYLKSSLAIRQSLTGGDDNNAAWCYSNLGDLCVDMKRFDEAEAHFQRAMRIRLRVFHEEHPQVNATRIGLARMHREKKEFDKAEPISRRVVDVAERIYGANHRFVGEDLEFLAEDLDGLGRKEEAEAVRQRAKKILALKADEQRPAYKAQVEVLSSTAYVQGGNQAIATARQGQKFDVIAVNGPWVGISLTVGGEKKTGWIKHLDVIAVATEGLSTELAWTEIKPENARATISFPGSPRPTKQVVSGVENFAYEATTPKATFVFSFFDVPAGSILTFDAAINAYSTRRNGTVTSEQTLNIDDHAGKECMVRLADGTVSRLRLLAVGRRWYQLIVEGNASAVSGEESKKFVESFKLTE
jgi:tetratricopeptide (TPR) repeat protein